MQYKFKFSVIMPVYNVEKYLNESIKSVVRQSIGFKKNIQLILVNDGSVDKSEEICLKYAKKYPDNIVYVRQKNSGASSARNKGNKYVKGKYVNYLDSDDKWKRNTFKKVWDFFEKNEEKIDLVACRIKFFGASKKYHLLDYKFDGNKIINIDEAPSLIQLNGPTTFIKASLIKKNKFDETLKYGEDPLFVNKIILDKKQYGVVKKPIYYYRKRKENGSMQDKAYYDKDYYIQPLVKYLDVLCKYSKSKYKAVLKYVQFLIVYELYWKIKSPVFRNVLSDSEIEEYHNIINSLIKEVDDDVILNNSRGNLSFKINLLSLKHKKGLWKKIKYDNDGVFINGEKCNLNFENLVYRKIRASENKMIIYGKFSSIYLDDDFEYYLEDIKTNKKYFAEIYHVKNFDQTSFNGEVTKKGYMFRVELPINKKNKFINYINYGNEAIIQTNFTSTKSLGLKKKHMSYTLIDNKCAISKQGKCFVTQRCNYFGWLTLKFKMLLNLLLKLKIKTFLKYIYKDCKNICKYLLPSKNIIIMESNPDFTDNTKLLFDKMIKEGVNDKYKIVWFVNDHEKFKNINIKNVEFLKFFDSKGKKVQKSDYTKFCYRRAKIIIDNNKYIQKNNNKQIRIHINHGSPFKNAIDYNSSIGPVDYIVVQSKFFKETESKIRDTDINKIIPLGFPRNDVLYKNEDIKFDKFDELKKKKNKIILWLPTYKAHKKASNKTGNSKYGLNCIDSEKELLSLNKQLKKNNVVIAIKFHPAEDVSILNSFNLSNIIILRDEEISDAGIVLYQLFNKVDALITDYSSVYYDFCLTKKNIGLAISDFEEYKKEQGNFQFEYKDVFVGNYMYNNKDLLKFIDDVSSGNDETYKERMKVVKQYDDYGDGKATDRIYEFLKKFL